MAAQLRAFETYVSDCNEAAAKLKRCRQTQLGALVLLGAEDDEQLLLTLAKVAVETPESGLQAFVKGSTLCDAKTANSDEVVTCCGTGGLCLEASHMVVVYVRSASSTRRPQWRAISSHEFEALPGDSEQVALDFRRLVRILRCPPAPCLGPGTYFVSLTYPNVSQALATDRIPIWVACGKDHEHLHDAIEVRSDLFERQDEEFILAQLATVRRYSDGLPIIFTVRSKIQGGGFEGDEAEAWKLTLIGLRFGVEYIDVEAGWSREGRSAFYSMAKCVCRGLRIIGSHHEVQQPLSRIVDNALAQLFHECAHGPEEAVDIVKVVGRAESAECSIRMNQCALRMRPLLPNTVFSVIAICTTEAGRLSRALNVSLGPTPVAHPALPGKAAPGQLSAVEVEIIRQVLGLPANPFRRSALSIVATGENSNEGRLEAVVAGLVPLQAA